MFKLSFGLFVAAPLLVACASAPSVPEIPYAEDEPPHDLVVERITTAVPWPRGVRFVDGQLFALARGVHRSAGGPQADIDDKAGTIFVIDPDFAELATGDTAVGEAVRNNARVLAAPTAPPFNLWDRRMPATLDTLTDRPYCMLVWDEPSQNFFICGYSGIDIDGGPKFRKNATDAVHRFDTRTGEWHVVEAHDPSVVPADAMGSAISSEYYPHHDIATNAPPHGLVNGACGAVIAGDYLYVGAKDNTALAQYDLTEIRRNPAAPAPPGRYVFEGSAGNATFPIEGHGDMVLNGTCALAVGDGWVYVAFRTTSQIIRIPLTDDGDVAPGVEGQLVAQFPRYDAETGKGSANIYDMEFDAQGWLYVSPGYDGAIYRFKPDPESVYDKTKRSYTPYVDLTALVGAKKSGNICFDDDGNLYVCSGQDVTPETPTRGVIYRVRRP